MGGRGSGSASSKAGAGGRVQTEHMERWNPPPSLAQQLGDYTGQTGTTELSRQVSALKEYSGSYYHEIREAQYRGEKGTAYAKDAEAIETMIEKSPKWKGGELYRGIKVNNEDLAQFQKGAVIDMRGMSSWSSDTKIANSFSNTYSSGTRTGVIFRTKGTNKGTSITHLSTYGKMEKEILVSGKATWTITKVTKSGGKIYVDVVENP